MNFLIILATLFNLHGSTLNKVTYYGWPDNSPPGPAISYPQIHKTAGGAGTYADPVTFASSSAEFKPGTRLYLPNLKKYVIMEDNCVDCGKDWKKGISHIDIWIGGNGQFNSQVLACEDKWTTNKTKIVTNPPKTETVDSRPLFNSATGVCL